MGNKQSLLAKIDPLDEAARNKLCQLYRFSGEEVEQLHRYFVIIAGSLVDDGTIDLEEFQASLGFTNSIFAERVFEALDEDHSEMLEFNEFVRGFYLLSPMASKDEKIKFTFKIYDINGDESVSRDELYRLLRDVVKTDASERPLVFSDKHLREWVDATYESVNAGDVMGLREYTQLVEMNPTILEALTIPMNFLHSSIDAKFEKKVRSRAESLRKGSLQVDGSGIKPRLLSLSRNVK